VSVSLQNARRQLADLRIHHRLSAANRDHWRAALIHYRHAFLERNPLGNAGFILADPPAAGARQIAGMQRLQHQHNRKTPTDHRMWLPLLARLCR
jgi:hypothetical protein